jgi:hypothetical protein
MEFPFNNGQNLEAARKAVISNSVKKSNIELIIPIILGEYTSSVEQEYRYMSTSSNVEQEYRYPW